MQILYNNSIMLNALKKCCVFCALTEFYNHQLMISYAKEDVIEVERSSYPLPDVVRSSLSEGRELITNEIVREIGADLRRISKDFITARNQKVSIVQYLVMHYQYITRFYVPIEWMPILQNSKLAFQNFTEAVPCFALYCKSISI